MSRVSTASGKVAQGLMMGSCTSGGQHVRQGSVLPFLSVRQHAVQGFLHEACSRSSRCTARQGKASG